MAASEQLGSGTSFKQHYSSGAGICMPFGQSTWHCYVHVNMFSHAVSGVVIQNCLWYIEIIFLLMS